MQSGSSVWLTLSIGSTSLRRKKLRCKRTAEIYLSGTRASPSLPSWDGGCVTSQVEPLGRQSATCTATYAARRPRPSSMIPRRETSCALPHRSRGLVSVGFFMFLLSKILKKIRTREILAIREAWSLSVSVSTEQNKETQKDLVWANQNMEFRARQLLFTTPAARSGSWFL